MNKIHFLLIAGLSLLLFFTACDSNTSAVFDHQASLDGYVIFEDAFPDTVSALARVSSNFLILGETYTDENGYYSFSGLASGEYYVSFKTNGYSLSGYTVNLISEETVTADTVMMEKVLPMTMQTQLVDGVIDDNWQPVYTQDHDSDWGPNDYESLYLSYDDEYLYVAVTGEFEDNGRNTATIMFDIDGSGVTGIADFSQISGGDISSRLRKSINVADDFGADFAFNAGVNIASVFVDLASYWEIDQHSLVHQSVVTSSVMEFKIARSLIFGAELPEYMSLVAYIGAQEDSQYANDVIPQYDDFQGTFQEVFTIGF